MSIAFDPSSAGLPGLRPAARIRAGRLLAPAAPVAGGGENDARLLTRVAAGDRAAFARLYDRTAPIVFAFAHDLDPTRAEAAALAGFLEVWRRAPQWAGSDPHEAIAWILIVARAATRRHLRLDDAGRPIHGTGGAAARP